MGVAFSKSNLNIPNVKNITATANVIGVMYIDIGKIENVANAFVTIGTRAPNNIKHACLEKNPEFLIVYFTKINSDIK